VVPFNNQPIQFIDANGDPFPLKPGNTWNVIFGVNSGVVTDQGGWTFTFYIP